MRFVVLCGMVDIGLGGIGDLLILFILWLVCGVFVCLACAILLGFFAIYAMLLVWVC